MAGFIAPRLNEWLSSIAPWFDTGGDGLLVFASAASTDTATSQSPATFPVVFANAKAKAWFALSDADMGRAASGKLGAAGLGDLIAEAHKKRAVCALAHPLLVGLGEEQVFDIFGAQVGQTPSGEDLTVLVLRRSCITRAKPVATSSAPAGQALWAIPAADRSLQVQRMLSQMPCPMRITEPSGHVVLANPAYLDLLGVSGESAESLQHRRLSDAFLRELGLGPALERAYGGETVEVSEIRLRGASTDGPADNDRFIETLLFPTYGEDGAVLQVVAVLRDITEVKRDQDVRRALETKLRHAQKMEALGTLAGGVAHELNNVLAIIMGLASALKLDMPDDDPRRDDADEIIAAARRGGVVTRNLLGFARQFPEVKKPVSLNNVVKKVAALLRRTIPAQVALHTELSADLPKTDGDPNQLTQVLMNLCLNSIAALPDGGTVTIHTDVTFVESPKRIGMSELAPGAYIRLRVVDDGVGMDEETCRRALDPFFSTKPVGQGTGLGLSVVWGVVTNAGGTVLLESALGRGTTVTVLLPVLDATTARQDQPQARLERGHGTVLLVDDEIMIRSSGARLLRALGYDTLTAESGAKAIEIFQKVGSELDLVLLDLSMPGMRGEECLTELKRLRPEMPILLCTGLLPTEAIEGLRALGAAGIIYKPFDLDKMAHAVATAINARRK